MKRPPKFVLLILLALLLSLVGAVDRADAQPITNPTAVVFTPSTDHARVTAYEVGYFAVGATNPLQTASVAKSALTPTGTDYSLTFPRLLFGTYEVKLRACDSAATPTCSTWVTGDKQAVVLPFPPSVVRVQ